MQILAFIAIPLLLAGQQDMTAEPDKADTSDQAVAESTETRAPKIAEVDPDANKEVCRRFREIGSRIAHRKVCKTKAEWDKDREANAEVLRNPRGGGGPQMGNGG